MFFENYFLKKGVVQQAHMLAKVTLYNYLFEIQHL